MLLRLCLLFVVAAASPARMRPPTPKQIVAMAKDIRKLHGVATMDLRMMERMRMGTSRKCEWSDAAFEDHQNLIREHYICLKDVKEVGDVADARVCQHEKKAEYLDALSAADKASLECIGIAGLY